jgi:hypothetical protein
MQVTPVVIPQTRGVAAVVAVEAARASHKVASPRQLRLRTRSPLKMWAAKMAVTRDLMARTKVQLRPSAVAVAVVQVPRKVTPMTMVKCQPLCMCARVVSSRRAVATAARFV